MSNFSNVSRSDLVEYIWDAYKDANGVPPRWADFDSMSLEAIQAWADRLADDADWEAMGEDAWRSVDLGQAPTNNPFAGVLGSS